MKNKVRDGDSLEFVADAAYSSGDPVLLGAGVIGIVNNDVAEDDTGVASISGVFKVVKANGAAWTKFDKLYWDAGAKKFTKTALGNKYAGFAASDQDSADTEGQIHLNKSVGENAVAANVAQNATANGSDAASTQALANSLKTTLNGLLTALKNAGIVTPD